MSSLGQIVSAAVIVVPIIVLLSVGGLIALKSGVTHVSTGQDLLKVAGNFSQLVLRVAGYVIALIVLQYFIGMRPTLGW
jgi:autonomous glycyl radical cofactor GrcA